jgi:hypothetical protein
MASAGAIDCDNLRFTLGPDNGSALLLFSLLDNELGAL